MQNDCPFCSIDLIKTRIVHYSQACLVILSNPSLAEGHLLIIPKRHLDNISQLNKEELIDIFENLIKFENILLKKNSGCDIRQNFRPFIKQNSYKVNHLHFHLIPRNNEDELYSKSMVYGKDIFRFLSEEKLNNIIKRIEDAN